jgi:branched-subunit amino acid ABC-type transport system permease component
VDPGVLLQAVVTGLAAGAVLGLVGLGFTLVAGTLRVLHLAHGDVVIAAVFTGVLVVLGRTPVATRLTLWPALGFAALVLAAGAVLSAGVGWLAVRPYLADPGTGRSADPLGWLAALVAAGLLLREVLGLLLPQEAYAVPDPFRLDALTRSGVIGLPGGGTLPARVPAVLVLGLLLGVATERTLVRSRVGRALRAVADDPDAAALCGVPGRRVVLVAFTAAGLLAGAAGLLDAPGRAVGVDDGVLLGLAGIAAALLGGLGSLRGALAGGLAIGVLQSLVVTEAGGQYGDLVPLGVLVVLLAVRPEGLARRWA